MRDEKVIVDRSRLEELESKENTLDNHSDIVIFKIKYNFDSLSRITTGGRPHEEVSYIIREEALGKLAEKLEKVTRDRNSYRKKLRLIEDIIEDSLSHTEFKLFKRKSLIKELKAILNAEEN